MGMLIRPFGGRALACLRFPGVLVKVRTLLSLDLLQGQRIRSPAQGV